MMFVATLGKMPRFFCRFLALSSRSSSPPDPMLLSKLSPERQRRDGEIEGVLILEVLIHCSDQ